MDSTCRLPIRLVFKAIQALGENAPTAPPDFSRNLCHRRPNSSSSRSKCFVLELQGLVASSTTKEVSRDSVEDVDSLFQFIIADGIRDSEVRILLAKDAAGDHHQVIRNRFFDKRFAGDTLG